jgi:hypothetical protein
MVNSAAIIYAPPAVRKSLSHTIFTTLGVLAWSACILVLGYQAAMWAATAAWPSVTLMDISGRLNIDLLTLIRSLPLEFALKSLYVLATTELALALWWTGVAFFALTFINKVIFGR